ncbi:DUF982 domain-containing protein [Mesorhizobium sp. YC-39]|uniref:DUF982 domain-containing protein n=1 Tax=unclassified Mesorhizobium TaxID=325217 RepID=UPI0002BEF710|nr:MULTISPECIES: DUF982 domain-containing protein [unclassified Mesorhizobium]MCV3209989.1 DUF982 domain-containing protein [Mesorhizobium sp. YC-2]MCV3230519.1 DUF982 domain-containing protein [Mesorhizobium sp. YC-39]CCV15401.1 conserved hypothetical protein [Mesorhizobium sp. STM 4661]
MGKFLPLTVKFLDGQSMVVSSLYEAEIALQAQWPNKQAAVFKDAGRLIAGAKDGTCNPAVAFAAFKAAAAAQRVLQPTKQSAALGMLDDVAKGFTKSDSS